MPHVLVTNDFPPKVGGIQTYLYELWRRLPPSEATVLTPGYPGARDFDATHALRTVRTAGRVLWPTAALAAEVERLALETRSGLVLLDPVLLAGLLGRRLKLPYGVVLHGAEVTLPARLSPGRALVAGVLEGAACIIAAGGYPAEQARRVARRPLAQVTEIPPGVDTDRFRPLSAAERSAGRRRLGLPEDALLVSSVSRLVPRKGMDVLIKAVGLLGGSRRMRSDLVLAIAGSGRDESRLRSIARRSRVPVSWLGRVSDAELPLVYGVADVHAMCCRDRFLGLAEGFGIVFLEASACGVAQVAGRSGGSHEAVVDGETGLVVEDPRDVRSVASALEGLLEDEALRERLGRAGRKRAEEHFCYDSLARRLQELLSGLGSGARFPG